MEPEGIVLSKINQEKDKYQKINSYVGYKEMKQRTDKPRTLPTIELGLPENYKSDYRIEATRVGSGRWRTKWEGTNGLCTLVVGVAH